MTADLLVEIGTEELPPKALPVLMRAFADELGGLLTEHRLAFSELTAYASPRRLAVVVKDLAAGQPDRDVDQKGPPVKVAFDADGNPTQAAMAFARKCGVEIDALTRRTTEKGEWLGYRATEKGQPAAELLPGLVNKALGALPVPRPMRWGSSDTEFVRPVHWVVLIHGSDVVTGEVLGVRCGNSTRGHRFMAPEAIAINAPDQYLRLLEDAFVEVDFAKRRTAIEKGVREGAAECGGEAVTSDALFEEVTALVEWPVAITGYFDESFLALPREVIVATLTNHQRYFPIASGDGKLLPAFITVSNLISKDPGQVRDGNERVIQPRLADAAFFWESDQRTPLAARIDALERVVYQRGLGSMKDKSDRVAALAGSIAGTLEVDPALVQRAAELAKCDLLTGMVGEFPELQGTMGRYYALADGEDGDVADAIGEQYLPRFAGDAIPATVAGRCLSVADKLDTLCGIFALGKKPSGNRDPFGLRRAALGLVRILVEGELDIDVKALIEQCLKFQPVADSADGNDVFDYVVERMRNYYLDRGDISSEMFEAVRVRPLTSLLDFHQRLLAVAAFVELESAASLAAANKRIANILRQAEDSGGGTLKTSLFSEDAESGLHTALVEASESVAPLVRDRHYAAALTRLADLRAPVDRFFDDVMVMADDEAVRRNRLALLTELRALFLDIADVSRLSIRH